MYRLRVVAILLLVVLLASACSLSDREVSVSIDDSDADGASSDGDSDVAAGSTDGSGSDGSGSASDGSGSASDGSDSDSSDSNNGGEVGVSSEGGGPDGDERNAASGADSGDGDPTTPSSTLGKGSTIRIMPRGGSILPIPGPDPTAPAPDAPLVTIPPAGGPGVAPGPTVGPGSTPGGGIAPPVSVQLDGPLQVAPGVTGVVTTMPAPPRPECSVDASQPVEVARAVLAGQARGGQLCPGLAVGADPTDPSLAQAALRCDPVRASDHTVDCVVDPEGLRRHLKMAQYADGDYVVVGVESAPQARCNRSAGGIVIDFMAARSVDDRSCVEDLGTTTAVAEVYSRQVQIPPAVMCSPQQAGGERCSAVVPEGRFFATVQNNDGRQVVTSYTQPVPLKCRQIGPEPTNPVFESPGEPDVGIFADGDTWRVRADFEDGGSALIELDGALSSLPPQLFDNNADGVPEIWFLSAEGEGSRLWSVVRLEECDWELLTNADGEAATVFESDSATAPARLYCREAPDGRVDIVTGQAPEVATDPVTWSVAVLRVEPGRLGEIARQAVEASSPEAAVLDIYPDVYTCL